MGGVIGNVLMESIASELQLQRGDVLLAINGVSIEDLIDYNYGCADEKLELLIQKKNGEKIIFELEHEQDEDLGIEFAVDVFDGIRTCRNNCLFCFVDQLPQNCRKTLKLRDDDYRMSFMEGSYITCTNMSEHDFLRINRLRLSPLYISIHTTNPELRVRLMRNPQAGNILQILHRLKTDGIYFHGQLVLCPGFNDGEELKRTIEDLLPFAPQLLSLAMVPVGLTEFQKNSEMRQFNKEESKSVIALVSKYQQSLGEENFLYLADEFYLLAEEEFPVAEHYNDFCQIENGVGMSASFYEEWKQAKVEIPKNFVKQKTINLITGISGAEVLKPIVTELNNLHNLQVNLFPIKNKFFGETVTVSGLVTGGSIFEGMKEWRGQQLEKPKLIIPDTMLKFDEPVFLDDMTVSELEKLLDTEIIVIGTNAFALAEIVSEEN